LNRRGFIKLAGLTTVGLGWCLLRPTPAVSALKIGDTLPKADLLDRNGQRVSLPGDLRGRVGLLHFWASWCPYCLKEILAIESLYQTYKHKSFSPHSINVGETAAAVEAFLAHSRISYSIVLDKHSSLARQYGVTGIPTTLIVGRDGLIRFKILGEIPKDNLAKLVSPLLAL